MLTVARLGGPNPPPPPPPPPPLVHARLPFECGPGKDAGRGSAETGPPGCLHVVAGVLTALDCVATLSLWARFRLVWLCNITEHARVSVELHVLALLTWKQ